MATAAPPVMTTTESTVDWVYTEDIQRMLDAFQTDAHHGTGIETSIDFPSALDLELGGPGWELDNWVPSAPGIGVF
jgi:hypothetical protein